MDEGRKRVIAIIASSSLVITFAHFSPSLWNVRPSSGDSYEDARKLLCRPRMPDWTLPMLFYQPVPVGGSIQIVRFVSPGAQGDVTVNDPIVPAERTVGPRL